MGGDAIAAAFAYAWWLTGDEGQAAEAVRTAVDAGAPTDDVARLLPDVRAAAVAEPTMCPASELALLHDVHGLDLALAAELVALDERDALTELAHGRLEALPEAPRADFAHPERLGGLTAGNPADVAHARQCASCGQVAGLLDEGRRSLTEIAAAAPPGPGALLGAGPPTPEDAARRDDAADGSRPTEPQSSAEAEAASETPAEAAPETPAPSTEAGPDAAAPAPDTDARDDAAEDTDAAPDREPGARRQTVDRVAPRGRRLAAAGLSAAALGGIVAIGVAVFGSAEEPTTAPAADPAVDAPDDAAPEPGAPAVDPDGPASDTDAEPARGATTPHAPSPTPSPAATPPDGPEVPEAAEPPEADLDAFGIVSVDLVGVDGRTLSPEDPIALRIVYRGAGEGVGVDAHWTVDGEDFRDLDVTLVEQGAHVLGEPVPPEGWPQGDHRVILAVDGEMAALMEFLVE